MFLTTPKHAPAPSLGLPAPAEASPFRDSNWTAMRHRGNNKIFALIFLREGRIWLNLTAEPMRGDFWRRVFPCVVPAYHMNKEHWISVILDGSMEEEDICRLIEESFELTAPKRRVGRRETSTGLSSDF